MPTNTTNYNLVKPTEEEFYDVNVQNNNMDILDSALRTLQNAIASGATEEELLELQRIFTAHIRGNASTEEKGHVQLDDSTNSTSTNKAATPNAVNKLRKSLVDENGKLLDGVIPSSIENYVRIALLDFLANPTALARVSGLSEYKKILIRLMQTKTNTTSTVVVQITYNRQMGNSMYVGSSTAGLINATSVNVPVTSTYPIANGDIEIDNQNLYYQTEMKTYNETLDGNSGSHSLGIVSLRSRLSNPLDVLEFMVSGSGNSFIGGKIEVLGVRR